MIRSLLLLSLSLVALAGCGTDCPQYCNELAAYWEDCDIAFDQAEVAECKQTWRKGADPIPGDELERNVYEKYGHTCSTLTRLEENDDGERVIALRARFTCDDMRAGPGAAFGR